MSDDDTKFPKKAFCYKDDCKVVRSGFHLENYPVCKNCKQEITEILYKRIKDREKSDKELQDQIDKIWDKK